MPFPLFVAVALALFPLDAHAWGLHTHIFFAHELLAMTALFDPKLRAAARKFPDMVLAGACLPDLAITGKALGTAAFRRAHRWSTLRRMTAAPRGDAERALALGYASHLVVDVIAHNVFVPEHESRIARVRHVTHAIAEWAMDRHIASRIPLQAREALATEPDVLADFAAHGLRCNRLLVRRGIAFLGYADGALRASPLPAGCQAIVRLFDGRMESRFEGYLRRAKASLRSVEAALNGRFVDWESSDPEGQSRDERADRRARQHIARVVQAQHDA